MFGMRCPSFGTSPIAHDIQRRVLRHGHDHSSEFTTRAPFGCAGQDRGRRYVLEGIARVSLALFVPMHHCFCRQRRLMRM